MKQSRTTNKESRAYVNDLTPFKASNLEGREEGNYYVVYSYGWYPIFAYSILSKQWFECDNGYSRSTKRQMLNCRPSSDTVKLSPESMKDLLRTKGGY